MANNTLDKSGIVTGEIVEAVEVYQIVDALTGVAAANSEGYDITISGSLNLTGSLLMTGSFINEYDGQFTKLGLGVASPAPSVVPTFHLLTTAAIGTSTAAIIEQSTVNEDATLRFQNDNVKWDLGAFGTDDDQFKIIQDRDNSPIIPFIMSRNSPTYNMWLNYRGVGVGLGSLTVNTMTDDLTENASIQAGGTISGSLVAGSWLSASKAGVGTDANIHGTASFALYSDTAGSVAAINLGDVVMAGTPASDFSASDNFNSAYNINTTATSSFAIATMGVGGIEGLDLNQKIISGSYDELFLGNVVDNGVGNRTYIKIDDTDGTVYISGSSTGRLKVNGSITAKQTITSSGSAYPRVVVGPKPSSTSFSMLLPNDLQFNNNDKAYVSNLNNSVNSKLSLAAGGGSSNVALTVSASKDVTFAGTPICDGASIPAATNNVQGSNIISLGTESSGDYSRQLYRTVTVSTAATTPAEPLAVLLGDDLGANAVVNIKVICMGVPTGDPFSGKCTYLEQEFTYSWDTSGTPSFGSVGASTLIVRSDSGTPTLVQVILNNSITIGVLPGTSFAQKWSGVIEWSTVLAN